MMKVTRILNNNAVCSLDEAEDEIVVMGKGIGFQKRPGDVLEEQKIEKIFSLPKASSNQFQKLVAEIPYEQVKVAAEIIEYAKSRLNRELNRNIYISLTDHLNFALARQEQGILFQNALLWEIRKYYSEEFAIGQRAVELIEERLKVRLSEDEAGFFAIHIVNAQMGSQMSRSMEAPEMIKDMLNIVKYSFHIEFDEDSLVYERFLTHLKFFIQRMVRKEAYPDEDKMLFQVMKERFPKEYRCAKKIKNYMEQKVDCTVAEEEVLYLTMHIARIARRTE